MALLYGKAELDDVQADFGERVADTVVGVAIAYAVAGVSSALAARRSRSQRRLA